MKPTFSGNAALAGALFILTSAPFAYPFQESLQQDIVQIIQAINNTDFTAAENLQESFKTKYGNHPSALFLQTYEHFWREIILGHFDAGVTETGMLKSLAERTIKQLESSGLAADSDAILFRACSYLFLGLADVLASKSVSGFLHIVKSVRIARRIPEGTTAKTDSLLITANYHYYHIFPNKNYLDEFDRVIYHGLFFPDLALFTKGKILLEDVEDYSGAVSSFSTLVDRYPSNLLFRYYLASSYVDSDELDKALESYLHIIFLLSQTQNYSELLWLKTHFALGQLFEYGLRDNPKALEHYGKIVEKLNFRYSSPGNYEKNESLSLYAYALFHIGQVYVRMMDYPKALVFLEQVQKQHDSRMYDKARDHIDKIKSASRYESKP